MNIILNNPYRKLSVLANAKLADITSNYSRIKMYVEADSEIPDKFQKYVFDIGENILNQEQLDIANSKITLDKDKFENALFWFYDGHLTDEPAFDELNDGNIENAISIWEKRTEGKEIDNSNLSAFHNLSTILIWKTVVDNFKNISQFKKAIQIKLNIIESDFFIEYLRNFTASIYTISPQEAEILFLSNIQTIVQESNKSIIYFNIIEQINFLAKDEINKKNAELYISQLENLIKENENSSKLKSSGYNKAIKLYDSAIHILRNLEGIIGRKSIKYSNIADKIALKIFQNGRDYFMHYRDESDPSSKSMDAFKKAKSLAVGSIALQQIDENINQLNEWIADKPERDKQKLILIDFTKLIEVISRYEEKNENIDNAKSLLDESKPLLLNIKNKLGQSDSMYLKLSTRVVMVAQSYIIEEVNVSQSSLDVRIAIDRNGTLNMLKRVFSKAWDVTKVIGTFDMEQEFRTSRYNPNRDSLKNLCNQIGVRTDSVVSSSSNTSRQTATSTRTSSPSTSSINRPYNNSGSENNAWLVLGGIGLVIGAFSGGFGGAILGALIGATIGLKLSN